MDSDYQLYPDPGFTPMRLTRPHLSKENEKEIFHLTGKIYERDTMTHDSDSTRSGTQKELENLGWKEAQIVDHIRGTFECRRRTVWVQPLPSILPEYLTELTAKHRVCAGVVADPGGSPTETLPGPAVPLARPGDFRLLVQSKVDKSHDCDVQAIVIGDVDRPNPAADARPRATTLSQALKANAEQRSGDARGQREEWRAMTRSWKRQLQEMVAALHSHGLTWGAVGGDAVLVCGRTCWIVHFAVPEAGVPYSGALTHSDPAEWIVKLGDAKAMDLLELAVLFECQDWK